MGSPVGRCAICHKPGSPGRTRNFLCADCADSNLVIIYCAKCGDRKEYEPEVVLPFLRAYLPSVPVGPGTCVRMSHCALCTHDKPPLSCEAYVMDTP